jgi:heme/copper-type cytochrome/quinol oxidase subunit 2
MCGTNHWQIAAAVEVLSEKDYYYWLSCLVYLGISLG